MIQPEHVAYAITGLALDMEAFGLNSGAKAAEALCHNPLFLARFAALLREAKKSEELDELISDRIIAEKKAAR